MGLTRKTLKGGTEKGAIMKFASFLIRIYTVSSLARADWRLEQMRLSEGSFPTPG